MRYATSKFGCCLALLIAWSFLGTASQARAGFICVSDSAQSHGALAAFADQGSSVTAWPEDGGGDVLGQLRHFFSSMLSNLYSPATGGSTKSRAAAANDDLARPFSRPGIPRPGSIGFLSRDCAAHPPFSFLSSVFRPPRGS